MRALFSIATLIVLTSGQISRPNRPPELTAAGEAAADATVVADRPAALAPLVWRAFGRGARAIAFRRAAGPDSTAWNDAVASIRRQFDINGALLAQCRPGPAVRIEGVAPAGVEIALLEAQRTWIVVATNTSAQPARVDAVLPPAVPYAMWLNLLDGSSMAMLEQTAGPRWRFDIAARGVKTYVIDKTLK
jgi:hypothetical protein